MIRLALIGNADDVAAHARVAPRLRGGRFTAVACGDAGAAQVLGAAAWSDDFDTLLSRHGADFDAVVLRHGGRPDASLGRRAAAAGKHVLAESPLASSAEDASAVLGACAAASVRLMVGQVTRFFPSLRVVKDGLDAGRLGEPGLVRVHRWESSDTSPPTWENEIDLVCWLFGCRPAEVYAAARRPRETDYRQIHLGFDGGGMALIDRARTLPAGDGYFSLSVIGSAGAAYADDHHNTQLLFAGGRPSGLCTGQGDLALLAMLQEFVTAVAQGREPSVPGADGLRALQVSQAAAASAGSAQALRWTGARYEVGEGRS